MRAVSSNEVAGQAKPEIVSATPVKAWESTYSLQNVNQDLFAQHLSLHVKQFVIAHEVAHVMLGHLRKAKERAIRISTDINHGLFETERNEEFEADKLGLRLTLEIEKSLKYRNQVILWGFIGADSFFGIIQLIEKVFNIKSSSHPSAFLRREKLRTYIRDTVKGESDNLVSNAREFEKLLNSIIDRVDVDYSDRKIFSYSPDFIGYSAK